MFSTEWKISVPEKVFLLSSANPTAMAWADTFDVSVCARVINLVTIGTETSNRVRNYWIDVSSLNALDQSPPTDFGKSYGENL